MVLQGIAMLLIKLEILKERCIELNFSLWQMILVLTKTLECLILKEMMRQQQLITENNGLKQCRNILCFRNEKLLMEKKLLKLHLPE